MRPAIARRHLFLTACGTAFAATLVVLYLRVWAPNSLRTTLDRIQLGMNEADARQLLANFQDEPDPWPETPPKSAEVWKLQDGDSKYAIWQQPIAVTLMLRKNADRPNQIAKGTSSGIAYIDLEDHRVIAKTWLEFPRQSLVDWIKAKFQ